MIVYNNANRMLRLIDELMDFRKFSFNKTKFQVERCNLSEILSSVVSNFTIEASERKITQETNLNFQKTKFGLIILCLKKLYLIFYLML